MNKGTIKEYDVIVIGGGHSGCEAALAAAKMGMQTIMFAINLDSIAMMPCNPNIGGTSKGHLVREIDALGGQMGKNIDKTFIQSRMLNTTKGPAVHSLRAQADKQAYAAEMKRTVESTPNLHVRQGEVIEILTSDGKATGVKTDCGVVYNSSAIILCTGTYLNARCLTGEAVTLSGPNGLKTSVALLDSLQRLGIETFRFKTGTPARIDGNTINTSLMDEQKGDERIVPFSFDNEPEELIRPQISCYLTYTNEKTHQIIKDSLHRSPMYSGVIEGTGTRYCPSIEDKVVRFSDKDRHQLFIEPEGLNTCEMYVSGLSTSLPEDVQEVMYRSVPGLENCRIMRNGYAIEYDCINATQLTLSLMFKKIPGLFSAGQFNGSSGYEEAAAQGLIAGINAALYVKGGEAFTIDRSEGYIGVLIDDLVTKGSKEPYRMMTSRAEYRLLLRQDNADLRLTEKGYALGLIPQERYERFIEKKRLIEQEIKRVCKTTIPPGDLVNSVLERHNSTPITTGLKLSELIKRPELSYMLLVEIDKERPALSASVAEQVNIQIKYEGYIKRQLLEVDQFKKLEGKKLPKDIDYDKIHGLRLEARQKLNAIRPENIGQVSRIAGVSPADISVLLVRLFNGK